jgi:hypothetical protein
VLKVLATLPEAKHFRQIENKGDRYQWCDLSCDYLRILASDPNPWDKEWLVLIRLEQGKRREGSSFPRRLNLLCLPVVQDPQLQRAKIIRDRWGGNFAHSCEPTLLHFDFPVESKEGRSWLMVSVVLVNTDGAPQKQEEKPFPMVDPEDQHFLKHKWRPTTNGWVRRYRKPDGTQPAIYLHREILGITGNQSIQVIFKNENRLDCRRSNMQALTMSELVQG